MLHLRDVEHRRGFERPPGRPVVSERWVGRRCVLSVEGEIDIADVPVLERAIESAVAAAATEIWIDLEPTSFIDVACVHCLLRAQSAMRQLNRRLAVIAPPESQPRRVFVLTEACGRLELHASRNGAHLGTS